MKLGIQQTHFPFIKFQGNLMILPLLINFLLVEFIKIKKGKRHRDQKLTKKRTNLSKKNVEN